MASKNFNTHKPRIFPKETLHWCVTLRLRQTYYIIYLHAANKYYCTSPSLSGFLYGHLFIILQHSCNQPFTNIHQDQLLSTFQSIQFISTWWCIHIDVNLKKYTLTYLYTLWLQQIEDPWCECPFKRLHHILCSLSSNHLQSTWQWWWLQQFFLPMLFWFPVILLIG